MHAIISIVGITPEAISKLHAAVGQSTMYTHEVEQQFGPPLSKVPYVKIVESKLDTESGTYTAALHFDLIILSSRNDQPNIFTPLSTLDEIFKSIDPRLLPDAKAVELEKARATAEDALAERISAEILGQTCSYDITNGTTGEVIVPANHRITRSHIRKIVSDIANLNLGQSETNDSVVIHALRRIQLEQKSAQPG